jgi:RNA polymerase sigma-70 factor (ECF subfamily)
MNDPDDRRHGAADFDATFHAHYERMVRSLTVACGDREAAADAVQDAFIRAYARWRRISRYDDPAGWVRHVALNRLRDHFRRSERGARAAERLGGQTAHVAPAPAEPADEEVLAQLGTLPQQQRIALALFYVEQLSVAEIAESMNLSDGAVKYHLHAGREGLRQRIEEPT